MRQAVPVKARDPERTVRSLSRPMTFRRNYHYCEKCQHGFYPAGRLLGLPEEGELTSEMEKRVLDFAVNDVYGECAARWSLHYREPISENLLRWVVAWVGEQCAGADQGHLHAELKPREEAAEVLVVEVDGSQLPIRGGRRPRSGCSTNSLSPTSRHPCSIGKVAGLSDMLARPSG